MKFTTFSEVRTKIRQWCLSEVGLGLQTAEEAAKRRVTQRKERRCIQQRNRQLWSGTGTLKQGGYIWHCYLHLLFWRSNMNLFFFLCLILGISSLQTFSLQTARKATSPHFDNPLQNTNCLVKVLFEIEHLSSTPIVMDGGCQSLHQ